MLQSRRRCTKNKKPQASTAQQQASSLCEQTGEQVVIPVPVCGMRNGELHAVRQCIVTDVCMHYLLMQGNTRKTNMSGRALLASVQNHVQLCVLWLQ